MDLLEELAELGCNIQDGVKRFLSKKDLYIRMLKKFPESASGSNLIAFIEKGDSVAAAETAHTLKGVTGNLSLTPLYTAYTEIVSLLRTGRLTEAKKLLEEILPLQNKIILLINQN